MINTKTVKEWIETEMSKSYSYEDPRNVRVIEDPQVRGTFAARFDQPWGPVDLMFMNTDAEEGTPSEVLDATLEEVEFKSWPPASGNLDFFGV